MTDALDLAKYIVQKCVDDGCPISNLQLQKLLYLIQKEYLRVYDKPAFKDDFEARQFGAMVPVVYYEFCYFGAMPIELLKDVCAVVPTDIDLDLVNRIVEAKRSLMPWELVPEVQPKGGVWETVFERVKQAQRDGGNFKYLTTAEKRTLFVIPIELIKEEVRLNQGKFRKDDLEK